MVVKTKSDPSKMKKNKTKKDKKGGEEIKVPGKQKRKKTEDTEETPVVAPKKLKKPTVQAEPKETPVSVDEEDLTPEERRVLERKMKKILKKEEKRRKKEEGSGEEKQEDQSKAAERALEYLTCWSQRREEWRFQKLRQTWLLQHMYDTEKVPDASFSVMLAYLENLRGAARDVTVEQAEAVVKEDKGDASQSADQQKRIQRALEVVRLLA